MNTKNPFRIPGITLGLMTLLTIHSQLSTHAQSTAFTYQGRVNVAGVPANGTYDLVFSVYGSLNGADLYAYYTNSAVAVSNGLFTVPVDFGPYVFSGQDRWIQIDARTNGVGPFTPLSPRQKLTPTPYAITAENLASGGLAGVYTNAVSFNNPNNNFAGNGGGLTNVNAASLAGLGANDIWRTTGNAGTTAGVNFLGTTDNQPLEIQVNATRALRIEPHGLAAPSLAGGYYGNSVAGFHGAAIAGGGTSAAANSVSGDYAFVGAGYGAIAGNNSVVVAGAYNKAPGQYGFVGTGLSNTNLADYAFIGGGANNSIAQRATNAFIGGGTRNLATNAWTSIGGGDSNMGLGAYATVGGGQLNSAGGSVATVGGGQLNTASGSGATISGGFQNAATIEGATVSGGENNSATGFETTVSGGAANRANGNGATVGGGELNTAEGDASTVAGGVYNIASGEGATIAGGGFNGSLYGTNVASGGGSFIGGGVHNLASGQNSVVSGGANNVADVNASAIAGGSENHASGDHGFIGGGQANFVGYAYDTIGGGHSNSASGGGSAVAAGAYNVASGPGAFVGGGVYNTAAGYEATVPGGYVNSAAGDYSFAAGQLAQALHQGSFVWADSQNAAFASTANDQFNVRAQGGVGIGTGSPRAQFNVNGTARFDALSASYNEGLTLNLPTDMPGGGYGGIHFHNASRGGAYGSGTIKWGMFYNYTPEGGVAGKGLSFVQSNLNTRLYISSNGNVGIGTNTPQQKLHVNGNILASGTITGSSDRNIKEHFAPINPREVLDKVAALPISRWNYKEDAETPHVGPMAQDFYAAFKVGMDDKHISMVDADGVALAAIQGLNQKLEEKDARIHELEQRLSALEKAIQQKQP